MDMWLLLLLLMLIKLSVSTFDPELHAKYLQMPRHQFIQYFNSQNYTWKIKIQTHLHSTFQGCLEVNDTLFEDLQIQHQNLRMFTQLPKNFDARDKWIDCESVKNIYKQGTCGSCWAFATATVASDRTCIGKGLNIRLSQQDFDCLQPICSGGSPRISFPFWRDHGLVTLDCKPYNLSDSRKCVEECKDPSINYGNDKHFADKVYRISSNDSDIKAELFDNGPVYASFGVYEDFLGYDSGVYVHHFGGRRGRHGVKVIGYGTEDGHDYWFAANSWGSTWGENGYFRIKRYQEYNINFEKTMYTGMAKN